MGDCTRILFLPNFRVDRISEDDPSLLPANKMVENEGYWFFKHLQGLEVQVIDSRAPFPFGYLSKIIKLEFVQALIAFVRQKEFDVILSHSFNSGFVFALIRSIVPIRGPPHFVIDVGSLNGGKESRLQIALLKRALKSVAGLIHHSTINEEFYAKHFPTTKREFVYLGENADLYRPDASSHPGDFALSIGHSFQRDYGTLVKAWSRIDIPLRSLDQLPSTSMD